MDPNEHANSFFRGETVLVTGARGFIGWHVAQALADAGAKVRGLTRSLRAERPTPDRGIEWFEADLTEPETLVHPLSDCRYVFHVAGDYRFWARDPGEIFRNNVEGTIHLLEAAENARVERIVCTSTQGILEPGTLNTPGDETRFAPAELLAGPYKGSKMEAWRVVSRRIEEGCPALCALPTAPIGPADLRPTPTGRIVVAFLNGQIPLLARTGLSFVDVRDVARGHLLAMMGGRIGENYLLGGHNLWLGDFLKMLEPWSRFPAPTRQAPRWLSRTAAFFSEGWARWSGSEEEPLVTRESVKMSERPYFFRSDKAMKELGYAISPLEPALEAAVLDFSRRGRVRLKG